MLSWGQMAERWAFKLSVQNRGPLCTSGLLPQYSRLLETRSRPSSGLDFGPEQSGSATDAG